MPVSANTYDDLIKQIVLMLKPSTFLDIGPGAGKYGSLVKEISIEGSFNCYMTAIEYDQSYIKEYNLELLYQDVKNIDARQLSNLPKAIDVDLCIMGDVLEHLPQSDGLNLLNYLKYRSKRTLLIIPLDLLQEEWNGHSQEAHISNWYPKDFENIHGASLICKRFGGIDFLLVIINGNQIKKRDWFCIFDENDEIYFGYPYKNLKSIDINLLLTPNPNRIALNSNFNNKIWNKRGNIEILTSNDELAPDRISESYQCNFKGQSEFWTVLDGITDAIYHPSIYLKKITESGVIQLVNPIHERKGLYEIDLSLLPKEWSIINEHHPSVKVLHSFFGVDKKIGLHMRNITNDNISINLWGPQI
jgi:hypothetical protein